MCVGWCVWKEWKDCQADREGSTHAHKYDMEHESMARPPTYACKHIQTVEWNTRIDKLMKNIEHTHTGLVPYQLHVPLLPTHVLSYNRTIEGLRRIHTVCKCIDLDEDSSPHRMETRIEVNIHTHGHTIHQASPSFPHNTHSHRPPPPPTKTITQINTHTTHKQAPSKLESTSLVLAVGLDLFFTRVTPSKPFDLLSEEFNHVMVSDLVVCLTVESRAVREERRAWLLSKGAYHDSSTLARDQRGGTNAYPFTANVNPISPTSPPTPINR